jgi:DNA-binding LacI/PurR family transcriptional regulator
LGIGGQDAVVLDNFAAAAMLLERLDAPDGAARKIVLGGRCVVRGSTMRQI